MRRRWLAAPALVLCLVAADALAWRLATAQLVAGADRWAVDAARQGWVLTHATQRVGGWPAAASLVISGVSLAGGEQQIPGGVTWTAQRVELSVSLLRPTRLVIRPEGRQQMRLSGLPDIVFTGARLEASIRLWGQSRELAAVDAVAVAGGLARSRATQDVQIAGLHIGLAEDGDAAPGAAWPSALLDVRATGVGLPDTGQWPLGARVAALGGRFLLASPRGRAVPEPGGMAAQAAAWRDGGGHLDASELDLRWGPLALNADASFGLDKRLQPAGTGRADVAGSAATLAALGDAGLIAPGLAATANALLAFMPQAPDGAVRLGFVLRDNTVSVGQIPLFRVKDIAWR